MKRHPRYQRHQFYCPTCRRMRQFKWLDEEMLACPICGEITDYYELWKLTDYIKIEAKKGKIK